jgi:RNA polymerase sigma-70 factor (ECF subfamily)
VVLLENRHFVESDELTDRSEFIREALARYESPLLRYAHAITGNMESARDVVQDTFVRLCDTPPDELQGHLAQWLFTVCRNRAIDHQRKESRMTPLLDEQLAARETPDPSPAVQAERREAAEAVLNWLDLLPKNQREVVRLKFQGQLSYEEIATVTSLSVSNVGFLLHSAIRTLRARMTDLETASNPN